jgi:hypothetical protein
MKTFVIICFLLFYFLFYASAQNTSTANRPYIITKLQQSENSQGHIQIIQDKKIDELMSKMIDKNAQKGTVRGYRIRIFMENSQVAQQKAIAARSKFLEKFQDQMEAYYDVKAPIWRVYVGDFRTQTDAFRMLKQIEQYFPNALIVRADVDYNKF